MADPVNKWDQPTAAPPPMFFGRKERDLVKQVNDELAERVVGQTVAYYPVSLKDSNYHPLYGEAVDKVTLPPVRVYAYVTVENEQTNERYGYEYQTKLTINFNRKRLTEDQNLFVRVGDFVQYGDEFYEIARTYNDTRYYFGQVEHKFQISAECIKARKGTFRIRGQMKKQTLVGTVTTASAALPLPAPPPAVPFAPSNAQYVVISTDPNLTKERVLTAGTGITLTDGGANGAITIDAAATVGGIFTQVDASKAYTTSSLTVGSTAAPTHTLTIPGSISGSSAVVIVGAATLGSTLNVSGAMVLVGTGSVSSLNMTGTLSASSTARFGSSISSSGDIAVTGAAHAANFYGDGSGLTNISADGVDVTSSTGDIAYPIVFTEGFQSNGSLGLGGNTALVFNPSDGVLSSSAAIQIVGNSIFGGTVSISGAATLVGTASVSSVVATGSLSGSSTLQAVGATTLGSTLAVSGTLTLVGTGSLSSVNMTGSLSGSSTAVFGSSISSSGDLAVTGNVHATAYYGDGANLTNVTTSPAGATTQVQYNNAGDFGASANLTFDGTGITVGTATVVGAMSGSSTLQAVGATTLGSTLSVSGAATLGATGSFSSVNMTGSLSGSSTAVFGSSVSSSGDLAVTGNVHAASYYGDGSNLTGVDAVSGSARQYSSTGMETSGYLKVSGSVTFAGTGSVSSLVATGSISGSSTFQAVGATVLGSSLGVSGSATFAGGITHNRTAITAATYTILVTDYYIGADTTSNVITLTLPAAATAGGGKTYVVKDEGGNSAVNAITIDGAGSETIDGVASTSIVSPYGALNLYTDGGAWFIY